SWDWLKILDFAQQNGFASVELRGLQGTMDLPSRPEFADGQIEQSKKDIASRGLRISCVSSSANMHDTGQEHEKQLADARRFIDLASRLGAPYVRVFGNKQKSTRLNSSHEWISYAVFCLKKKNKLQCNITVYTTVQD